MLRPHAGYYPGRMGDNGDDSLDITAMGAHVDRFGNTDAALLCGLRIHRLQREKNSRENSDRATKNGDSDRLGHYCQSRTGTFHQLTIFKEYLADIFSQIIHGENITV